MRLPNIAMVLLASASYAWAQEAVPDAATVDSREMEFFNLDQGVRDMVPLTVAKSETTAEEAPAVAEVITRAQIREWGYQTLTEVLQHIPGFYVIDDGINPNVAVRGVSAGLFGDSSIIKVMVDGHSVSFRSTSGNYLGPELIPLSAIERIEIIRGPASALYGADAFLGVINIITRAGEQLEGAEATGAAGFTTVNSSPAGDVDATIGSRLGRWEVLAGARYSRQDWSGLRLPSTSPAPTIPSYNTGNTIAHGLDQQSTVGLLKVTLHLDRIDISLTGQLASWDRGGEFSPWTQLSHGFDRDGRSNETRMTPYQGTLDLNIQAQLAPSLRAVFDAELFVSGLTSRDRIEIGSDLLYMRRQASSIGLDSNLELQWHGPHSLSIVAGVGQIVDHEQLPTSLAILKQDSGGLKAGDVLESSSVRQGSKNLLNTGIYAQALWTPVKRYLTLTGGFRYDYHNIYGSQPSGRVAAVSQVHSQVTLKLLYGTAFKAPSPLLLYAVPLRVGDVIGNPSLAPQYVHTLEAEASYRPTRFLSLRTDLAYSVVQHKAEFTPQGLNQVAENVGQVQSLSWETEASSAWRDWIKGYVNLDVNHTVREVGYVGYRATLIGTANILYPTVQLHAGVAGKIPLPRVPLRATVEGSYIGARRASEENMLAAGVAYSLPAYFRLDATLSTVGIKILNGRETVFSVIGRNLLGTAGPDPGFAGIDYPLAPRLILFQIRQQI
jgi:outer membrane receptor protein involved in Fe transport